MKKKLCWLMCAVLLLFSGCTAAAGGANDHDCREELLTAAQGDIDPMVQDFVTALCNGDEAALRRFTQTEETAARLAAVRVSDYALEEATDSRPVCLTLSVTESDLPTLPVGVSKWWVSAEETSETYSVRLCPIDADPSEYWLEWYADVPYAVTFCYAMATELELMDTVPDCAALPTAWVKGRGGDLVCVHNRLAKRVGGETPSHMSVEKLSTFADEVLGVTVDTFTAPPPDEEGMVELSRYGGLWYSASLTEYVQEGDRHTVTIRYWADATGLVEAKTVRYTAQEIDGAFRLLSTERLSETECIPLWFII